MRQLSIIAALIVFAAGTAAAEEIYKWTDESGNVHYSTAPESPQAQPAQLPDVGKENLDEKIQKIKSETPPNCEAHGGEDCTKGADTDGSVICMDGYRDALLPFRFHCMAVRLSTDVSVLFDSEPKVVKLSELDKARGRRVTALQISVRNLSAVEALDVVAEVELPSRSYRKPRLPATGPAKVEPFGLADYTIPLDLRALGLPLESLARVKPRVKCQNCSAVLSGRRAR